MYNPLLDRAIALLDTLKNKMSEGQFIEFSKIKLNINNSYYTEFDNFNYD